MIRKCMDCEKYMGEKEPFEDKSITTGICNECFQVFEIGWTLRKILKTIDYSSELGLEMLYGVFEHVKSIVRIKKFRKGLHSNMSRIKFAKGN